MPKRPLARTALAALTGFLIFAAPQAPASAGTAEGRVTSLPIPRYVSLKSERVNMRVGPGRDYQVSWLYTKEGLPVEVVQEYELWRRVRDSEGTEGWVYHSLLSGERTVIAAPWLKGKSTTIGIYSSASESSGLIAEMQPGVVAAVKECDEGWCEVKVSDRTGYVRQHDLWGVYPNEHF